MRADTLDILRCPYCGGHLRRRQDLPHLADGDELISAVLACHCARFPIVGGIPILTLEGVSDPVREAVERGDHEGALRMMFAAGDDAMAAAYDVVASRHDMTYRDTVEALGPEFAEGRYFLHRFSDPTFVAADGIVRALAQTVMARDGRALDLCGGSGHLSRSLQAFTPAPVLLDWAFPKLWLARRYTAPGCDAICADAHTALPFAADAFRLAVCSDAFHYVWTKALLAHELERVTETDGVVAITHAHNSLQPNPSAGIPLPPQAYRELFETMRGRVFADRDLLDDVLQGVVDLSRQKDNEALRSATALTVVAACRGDVFQRHSLADARSAPGELRINPLYAVRFHDGNATLALSFPSAEYEEEYADCRRYLPAELTLDSATLGALDRQNADALAGLIASRVVIRLPPRWC